MYKKIFLDELPRTNKGIDWKNSVGKVIHFIYEDISDTLTIKEYVKSNTNKHNKLLIEYKHREYIIDINDFKSASLGRICKRITREFKFEIGDNIVNDTRNFTVVDREYRERKRSNGYIEYQKWYKCHCNLCKHDTWILENQILRGQNCKCYKENNITITASWMIDYFQNGYDEAKLYSKTSEEKIIPKCPYCNKIYPNRISVRSIYTNHGINCSCRDNISYPEKFLINFLEQLCVNYDYQMSSKNLFGFGNYYYDFYLREYNCIIETHGEQHYRTSCGFFRDNKEIKENDTKKEILAKEYNIKYIILDCRESTIKWIKNSLLKSNLKTILNYSEYDIDWNKCELYAIKNLVKDVCDFKNEHPKMNTSEIAQYFPIKRETVGNYLKIGNKLGWCFYNGKHKIVKVYYENNEVGIYDTFDKLKKDILLKFNIKLCKNMIVNSYKNNVLYKGFRFECLN